MLRSLGIPLILLSVAFLPFASLAQTAPPTADWTFESNVAGERLGGWVAGAGDVNGDGFDDILASAPESSGVYAREGKVYLFLGSASGPGAAPDRTWTGQEPGSLLAAYRAVGDLDGDGYDEVLLSDGRLFMGSSAGPVSTPVMTAIRGRLGLAAGDVNGDGYGDVAVASAAGDDVYFGSPSGIPTAPSQVVLGTRLNGDYGRGPVMQDMTGDGYDDLVTASFDRPRRPSDPSLGSPSLHLFEGGPAGLSQRERRTPGLPRGEVRAALSGAGDVNGDGYADLILGMVVDGAGTYYGPLPLLEIDGWKTGLRNGAEILPDVVVTPAMVSGAGDVNGDGYDDALVGLIDLPGQKSLLVFYGSPDGLSAAPPRLLWSEPSWLGVYGWTESACCAGDVNGDGFADILVGSPTFSSGESGEGHIAIYFGGPGL